MEMRKRRRMTTIEAYAAHTSTSYGKIDPARFVEILMGSEPSKSEKVRVCEGLTKVSASAISGEHADKLASELGITRASLEARCRQLCGRTMGQTRFSKSYASRLVGHQNNRLVLTSLVLFHSFSLL